MRKVLKIIGFGFGSLVALLGLLLAYSFFSVKARLNATFQVDPAPVTLPISEEAVKEGERLAVIRGCTDCHGEDLGGQMMIDDPAIGTIYASNLTSGEGGVGAHYSDQDYIRAIRHGVDKEGYGLLVMPAQEFFVLSDPDVGKLLAYIRQLPPVDRTIPDPELSLMAHVLVAAGQLPPLAAEVIDHGGPRPPAPEVEVSAEYGAYLATGCTGCHGPDFKGGSVPGAPPDAPPAADLSPAGHLSNWTEADFVTALRTGVTPEGETLDPNYMPWPNFIKMTEVELKALWAFLQSIPDN